MSAENSQVGSIGPSMEFFSDPQSYRRFSTTRDLRRIIACIEPRFPGPVESDFPSLTESGNQADVDDFKVTIQTDGGAVGLGHDRALRSSIETDEVMPISEAIVSEAQQRIINVLDAHHTCKFLEGIVTVLEEEANPSEPTLDRMKRWEAIYGTGLLEKSTLLPLKDAAARQVEVEKRHGEASQMLKVVDSLYPQHPNVRHMAGKNNAKLHVVNHHPLVGINRGRQAREYGETAQAYHNNLAAIVERSLVLPNLSPRNRQLRAGAAIMRAAATSTVVMAGHKDGRFMEVFPDPDASQGLRIEEVKS